MCISAGILAVVGVVSFLTGIGVACGAWAIWGLNQLRREWEPRREGQR